MSGEKEGGDKKSMQAVQSGMWLSAPKGLWGVCGDGGGALTDHRQRNTWKKMNFTQQEKMKVLVVHVWFLINPLLLLYDGTPRKKKSQANTKNDYNNSAAARSLAHFFGIQLELMKWFTSSLGQVLL